jgi:hypothetical protein
LLCSIIPGGDERAIHLERPLVRFHRESTASKTDTPLFISLALHPAKPSINCGREYTVKMSLEPAKVSPAAYHAMFGLESFVNKSSKLEVSLLSAEMAIGTNRSSPDT